LTDGSDEDALTRGQQGSNRGVDAWGDSFDEENNDNPFDDVELGYSRIDRIPVIGDFASDSVNDEEISRVFDEPSMGEIPILKS
jgi:hypothetical protein